MYRVSRVEREAVVLQELDMLALDVVVRRSVDIDYSFHTLPVRFPIKYACVPLLVSMLRIDVSWKLVRLTLCCCYASASIPNIRWFGFEGDYYVFVMNLLDPSLEDLFNLCSQKFSLKTVLMLPDQVVRGGFLCGWLGYE